MKHLDEVINPPDFLTGAMANLSGQAADPFKIPPGTATQHDGGKPVMLDRLTRIQLTIFAVVTVICVGAISAFYLHLPAAVGIGAYNVTANFVAGGGLYQNANVTYRGVTIGRVESVGLDQRRRRGAHAAQQRHRRCPTTSPPPSRASRRSASSTSTWCRRRTRRKGMLRDGVEHRPATAPPIGQDIAGAADAGRRRWSTASATAGCRICCARRSRRSTDPGPSWRG